MAKRSQKSVRRVKETLAVPAARRRRTETALSRSLTPAQIDALIPVPGGHRSPANNPFGGTLGIGNVSPDDAGNIGTPGTLNVWGFITGEDYNPDLDGYPMFPKFDQMRRSDAQVSASLMQIKLPFKAARKIIKPASDDPEDLAIADFVTECLLADRAMKRSFEQVLDHAMLRFDFGCSGEEIIWEVGEGGELRFKDLAPRLPRTFYTWVEYESGPQQGDLQYLQQFAPKNGRYGFWNIPANKLLLHAHRKEGSNYYGMSILRPAYPNWFWKQQLYRIDAIRHDRLGAGIFIAKLGEKYNATASALAKIETTLQGLRSHDRAYVVQPWGVEYDILVPKAGDSGAPGLITSIEHHNQMIAVNVLQQFSTQGQQRHGSLGQAKVTHEAFMDALEGQAVEICAEFTDGAIRALCDANFDMHGRAYPKLVFADIASADVSAIAENMSKLAQGRLVTGDDDLEDWLRGLFDAPAMPEELRGRDRTPAGADPNAPPELPPSNKNKPHLPAVEASARKPFIEQGRSFGRRPNHFERRVFDLHGVPAAIEEQQAALVRALATIRRSQLKTVAARVAQKDARKTPAFTDLRHKHITMPQVTDLVKAIRAAQDRALAFGRQSVVNELAKQGVTAATELADNLTSAANLKTAKSALVSSAQITGRKQAGIWLSRVLDEALRLRRTGVQGKDLEAAVLKALEDEVESGAKRDAAQEILEAVALGRSTAAQTLKDHIETAIYSAILDTNTCETCADLDNEEFAVDSPEYDANLPPNVNCDGKDSCRCVYLFVAKEDEEVG